MTDDLNVFWHNNERAHELFYDLLARAEQKKYDDDFLAVLAAYRKAAPESTHADILSAHYLLAHEDAEAAISCGERAFQQSPMNPAVWQVLNEAYRAAERYVDALLMQCYASNVLNIPLSVICPTHVLTRDTLARMSVALGVPVRAPLCTARLRHDRENHVLQGGEGVFAGEFLPVSPHISPAYYVGAYTDQGLYGAKAWLLNTVQDQPGCAVFGAGDPVFDLIRGYRVEGNTTIPLDAEEEIVLPIIGTAKIHDRLLPQRLHIRTESEGGDAWISPMTLNYFRLKESVHLSSDTEFIVDTPIRIGHRPMRRKLVLNILADALPWKILGHDFARYMPKTHHFFQKGTTFTQHFSAAEYTYASVPTIETGMYMHHTHIFQDKLAIELNPNYITLSERMRTLGYQTAHLAGNADCVYNGATRGYDRILVQPFTYHSYEAVERTIRYLDGLHDADHFIFLHTADMHPNSQPTFQLSTSVQARLPLSHRLTADTDRLPSPYLTASPARHTAFWQSVQDTDRAFGVLFSYLENHYAPEDYIVSLYSDHGVPIFQEHPYIMSEDLTHATWMIRGAGVPEGVVADELTSAIDIYPTLGHLLGFPVDASVDGIIPRIFGGTGRETAYSNSMFPQKPYFLAVRAAGHSFFLETQALLQLDGTVDLSTAHIHIYPRDHELDPIYEVDNAALRGFFYPRVRQFLKGIGNNGEQFPLPKEL